MKNKSEETVNTSVSDDMLDALEGVDQELETQDIKEYLASIESELSDQSKVDIDQSVEFKVIKNLKEDYAARRGEMLREFDTAFKKENPKAIDFNSIDKHILVVNKANKGINYPKLYAAIMDCLLSRGQQFKSQKSIREHLEKTKGFKGLNDNLWSWPLKRYALTAIRKRAKQDPLNISLKGCKTLSDVRKAINVAFAKEESVQTIKVHVSLAKESLVISGNSYKIFECTTNTDSYKRVRVNNSEGKRFWVRVDALNALFGL